jgi:hypothetical protein
MNICQRGACIKTHVIGSLAISLGILSMLPSLSATEAQSSKQTASSRTKHAICGQWG